jgi:hypothetical protein
MLKRFSTNMEMLIVCVCPVMLQLSRPSVVLLLLKFSSEEEANAISKLNLVYDGADLEMKPKKDFDAERRALLEEINNGCGPTGHKHDKNVPTGNQWQNDSWGDSVLEDNSYPKGLIISFTLKKPSEEASGEGNDSKESAEVTRQSNSGNALDGHKSEEATNTESSCEESSPSFLLCVVKTPSVTSILPEAQIVAISMPVKPASDPFFLLIRCGLSPLVRRRVNVQE